MSSISITASTTGYTVTVSGGPANPADWVGLYLVGGAQNQWIDWKYLSNARSLPATGLASATLTFPAQTAGQYECRFMENNSYRVLATAAVAAAPPAPAPAPASGGIPGYFNVTDFGATGSPSGNDTKAVKLARDAALKTAGPWGSKGLYFPPGGAYLCTEPVDFLGISTIRCEGWLNYWGPVTEPCFKVGQPSQNVGCNHYFFGLTSLSVPYNQMRHPLIQFSGMRGGIVRIGSCNSFVEVAAAPGAYESTAYTEFHLGQTLRLELRSPATPRDATSGWINSNQFYGGTLAQLRIGGPWVDVVSVVGKRVKTATPHNFSTGDLVEMYNGTPADGTFQLVTAVDATQLDLTAPFAGSANPGNGWRCMSRSGYPHNDNQFWCPDIEDRPALVHIQGQCNRLERCRMEANGTIAFAPHTFMNSVEASNTDHGRPPSPGDFDMTVLDFSGGKNYTGWVHRPKPWGQN